MALNSKDYVFLARAVDAIGRHMFGDDWGLGCLIAEPLEPLPPFEAVEQPSDQARALDKYFSARLRAHRLLKSVDPAYAPKAFLFQRVLPSLSDHGATAALNLNDYAFTPGQWVQAQSIVDAYHHEARDAALRFAKACSTVLEEAIWGWLGTVRRPINAPVWAPIAPDVWSVVPPSRIFADCQIDPACLTLTACAGSQPEWVFVAQHDIATTLRNTFASRCSTTTRTGSAGNWVRLGPGFTASIRRLATEGHL